jgi:hypothetical protein
MVSKKFVLLGCLVTSVLMGSDYQTPYSGGVGAGTFDLPAEYRGTVLIGDNSFPTVTTGNENTTMGANTLGNTDVEKEENDETPANQGWRMEDFGD